VWDRIGQQVPVHDAVRLIYGHGDFDDDGASFARAFASAEGHLHGTDPQAAGKLTLNVIDQVANHGRDSLGDVTDGLGHVVGDHYARDLHLSAFNQGLPVDFDGDHDGVPGEATKDGISLSKEQTTRLVTSLIARDGARDGLMNGVAAYQTNLVHAGVSSGSDDWLRQIGKFDGLLNTANERNELHDYSDALAREHAIASGLDKVTSLLPLPKGIDVLASDVPDLVAGHFGPHGPGPADTSLAFHDRLIARMDSTIVASYVDAHPHVADAIPPDLDRLRGERLGFHVRPFVDGSGHVLPWGAMDDDQRQTFVRWVSSTPAVEHLTQGPLRTAHDAFYGNDQDQSVPPTVP
jgi:hypothetical protein